MQENKILGISAGRNNKITEKAVKTVLGGSGLPYEFYSLSNFEIKTCDACNGCIETHRCVKDDQINNILETMISAQGIVFGGPEYWGGMNAKARAFWERICFSTRHNNYFPFENKPGIIIGVSGDGNSSGVIKEIKKFTDDARINIIEKIQVQGEYACFTCGYGGQCVVGGLAGIYDLPKNISKENIPDICNQHPEKKEGGFSIREKLKQSGKELFHLIH